MNELKVDPKRRLSGEDPSTGVYVRAQLDGKWGSFDISELDSPSLHTFLRSRGGENSWAESIVAILLGHDSTVSPWSEENP